MGKGALWRSLATFSVASGKSVITLSLGFVITPYLLRTLGSDTFGFYQFLLGITAYIGLAEIGLNGSLISFFSNHIQLRMRSPISLISMGVRAYLKIMPLFLIGWVATYVFVFLTNPKTELSDWQIHASFWLIGFNILFTFMTPYRAFLECNHQSYIVDLLSLAQVLIFTILRVAFAYWGLDLFGQVLATSFSMSLYSSILMVYVHYKNKGDLLAGWRRRNKIYYQEIWSQNWSHVIFNVAGKLCLGADTIIVGAMVSPAQLTVFFLTQKLPNIVMNQLHSVSRATWAPLVQTLLKKEFEAFERRFIEINKFVLTLGLSAIVSIIIFNHFFLKLWVGEEFYGGPWLTALGCSVALFTSLYGFWGWIVVGTGNITKLNLVISLTTIINLSLSVGLTPWIGIKGPLLGSILTYIFFQIPMTLPILKELFKISLLSFIKNTMPVILFGILYTYSGLFLIHRILFVEKLGWFSLVASMITTSLIFLGVSFFLFTSVHEKIVWRQRFQSGLRRFKK